MPRSLTRCHVSWKRAVTGVCVACIAALTQQIKPTTIQQWAYKAPYVLDVRKGRYGSNAKYVPLLATNFYDIGAS